MKKNNLFKFTAFISALCLSLCTITPQAMETDGIIVDEDSDEMMFMDDDTVEDDFVDDYSFLDEIEFEDDEDSFETESESESEFETETEDDTENETEDETEGDIEWELIEEAEMLINDLFEAQHYTSWYTNDSKISAAIRRLDAFAAEYGTDNELFTKGSVLFFEDMGASGALEFVNSSESAGYTDFGSEDDATSIRNMLLSMNFIYECNKLRKSIGYPDLLVSDTMMGAAQASCNIANIIIDHPHLFQGGGEILAWGYDDPFSGWYTDEKELVDRGIRDFSRIGHYAILVKKGYVSTGFAIKNKLRSDDEVFFTACEEFAYESMGGMTASAYADRLINWMDSYINNYKNSAKKDTKIKEFITRLYSICLNRNPDAAGLDYWFTRLKSGAMTGSGAAYNFVFSNESKNKNLCNSCYLDQLYNCFMGRNADTAGKNHWLDKIARGATRGEVFTNFARSTEFAGICNSYGIVQGTGDWSEIRVLITGDCANCGAHNQTVNEFINRLYSVCFGRNADASGMQYYIDKIKAGMTGEAVALSFFKSGEFTRKNLSNDAYVDCLYQAFLGRAADASGKASWVKKLQNGTSRESVAKSFAASNEFKLICAQCGMKAK